MVLDNHSLSKDIAQRITERIISGELQPGDKLVEHAYADEFGTSRSPVREAIFLLAEEGLIERVPRKGAIVKAYSKEEICDLLEIRTSLEALAMKRVLEYGIEQDIVGRMESIYHNLADEKNPHLYTELNFEFHMCIIEMSKSKIIKNAYNRLKLPLLTVQSISFAAEGNIAKSVSEHRLLIEQLKSKNVEGASKMLHQHNRYVIESIVKKVMK